MAAPSIGADRVDERRERVPIIHQAVLDTFRLVNEQHPGALCQPLKSLSVLVVNCYFLLSNAFKRERLIGDNRTYDYKVAAITAAALTVVRPLRFARRPAADEDLVRNSNFDCATRASTALLNINLANADPNFVRRFHRANLATIDLPCLSTYLKSFDNIIFATDYNGGSSFESIENAIPFAPFNNVKLRTGQMLQIENLVNVYLLMKHSKETLFPD